MNDVLAALKEKYNKCLDRNKNAEEYLKAHTVKQCEKEIEIKGKGIGKNAFDLFNEVVIDLSNLRFKIEQIIYRDMTHEEIINGFK